MDGQTETDGIGMAYTCYSIYAVVRNKNGIRSVAGGRESMVDEEQQRNGLAPS